MTSKQTNCTNVMYDTQVWVSGGLNLIPVQTSTYFCDWTKLLTFLGIGFINSKMNRLNHKISLFSSALTFSDSNRKNQPYSYHVLHLKRNKTLVLFPILFFPLLFLHPQMPSPPHDCYRKWYWKRDPLVALNTLPKISLNY